MTALARLPRGLLVSVRSVEEAVAADAGGAVIIDVKEPLHGPLGRAPADVAAAITAAVGDRAAVTIACGELADGVDTIAAHVGRVLDRLAVADSRPAAIKAGSAGLELAAWREAHVALAGALKAGLATVAVAYADAASARSPAVEAIIREAAELGASTVLIDTFDKTGPGLLTVADESRLAAWLDLASELGLSLAVAGRLTLEDAATAARLGAGIVGVRSAACVGGRMGRVDRGHVAGLAATLLANGGFPASVTPGAFA